MSEDLVEEIDFWTNLKDESLSVKKGSAVSPTKLVLCRPREDLRLSDSDEDIISTPPSPQVAPKSPARIDHDTETDTTVEHTSDHDTDKSPDVADDGSDLDGSPVIVDSQEVAQEQDEEEGEDETSGTKSLTKADSFDLFERSDDEE